MKKYKLLSQVIIVGAFIFFFANGFQYPTGSPGGKTGSPGDGGTTCTQCHSGTAIAVSGWIATNIPEEGYTEGNTYTITANGTHTGVVLFGFEVTSEDAFGNKVGTFAITNTTQTQLKNNNASVSHTGNGNTPSGDSKSWEFDWTASSDNEVTFYGAFNAANGNGSNSGDVIYTSNLSVIKASSVNNAPIFTSEPVTSVYTDDTYEYLIVSSDDDQDNLTIIASTLPGWLAFNDNGDGTASLTGTPDASHEGNHDVVLEVSDEIAESVLQNFTVVVEASTSVDNLNKSSLHIYPNPSNGLVFIENYSGQNSVAHVYNLSGQKIKSVQIFEKEGIIDLTNLDAGVYFIGIINEMNSFSPKKIVIY